jgi:hypothetical protein
MYLDRYSYQTNESFLDYEFVSEGPKGKNKKVVRFTAISNNVYNLGFGDLNEETGEISDTIVTNNNDSRKVLATVVATVHDFTQLHPKAWVIAKGNTQSRTRLYRIGITNYLREISKEFELYGLKDNQWQRFEKRKDYEAFLVKRKII